MKRLTKQDFVKKAKNIHGNKYDYSKVNYINNCTKIIIICKKHNKFKQIPSAHLSGKGCLECSHDNFRSTTQQFIKKAKNTHGNKYDYSKVSYINNCSDVEIICPYHGNFKQRPSSHLNGGGCTKCFIKRNKQTNKDFITKLKQIYKNKYDYSKVNYVNPKTKIIIICKKHGEFRQLPYSHLNNNGCRKCYFEKNTKTTQQFIKKAKNIHGNRYDYSKTTYIKNNIKIKIICKKHGEFLQTPASHYYYGCPNCSNNISKNEIEWLNKMEKEQNIIIKRNPTIYINGKLLKPDGFHKITNTWYEYNGYFWHGHPNFYNSNDIHPIRKKTFGKLYQQTLKKEKLIKSAGYNLIIKWGK